MSMLLRFDPFREIDRVLEQSRNQLQRPSFPMDAYRHGETFVLHFDLPGVDPASIDMEYERNVLTVAAERSWRPVEGDDIVANERVHGSFRRQLLLGDGLDASQMHASYENGVLTVTIPVAEKAKPRKVAVETPGQPTAIDATSHRPFRARRGTAGPGPGGYPRPTRGGMPGRLRGARSAGPRGTVHRYRTTRNVPRDGRADECAGVEISSADTFQCWPVCRGTV